MESGLGMIFVVQLRKDRSISAYPGARGMRKLRNETPAANE
jgi:hypothetical protein